jgi:hypothetical protein
MRNHYWTISKFADWLRGTPTPGAQTSEGWDAWHEKASKAYPIRYWIAEEGLDYLQKVVYYIPDQIYSFKYYINNRFVTRTHALTAHARDIKPGQWQDVGNRFLPCLFNELVDFVEIETAWSHIAWGSAEDRAKYQAPFWSTGWFRWRTWRCPQAGLDHLDWAMTLTNEEFLEEDKKSEAVPTHQALAAREMKELYTWWTVTYRNRPDPYEASGWTAACEASRIATGGRLSFSSEKDPVLKKASDKAHKLLQKIEKDYTKEDEAMMIRLIKIRESLWT